MPIVYSFSWRLETLLTFVTAYQSVDGTSDESKCRGSLLAYKLPAVTD